jgi:hypothetical protein
MDKLRKGDRVRVMATVDYDQADDSDRVSIRLDTALDTIRVDAAAVEFMHHEVKVGQWVSGWGRHSLGAKVLAVAEGHAMVRADENSVEAWALEDIGLVADSVEGLIALRDADGIAPDELPRLVPRITEAAE